MTSWEDDTWEQAEPMRLTKKKSGGSRLLIGCCVAFVGVGLVVAVGCAIGWSSFFHFGVNSDLTDYAEAIAAADLEATVKQLLLEDIELIRESFDERNNFSFLVWIETTNRIHQMIGDHEIDEFELEALQREFATIKRVQGLDEP